MATGAKAFLLLMCLLCAALSVPASAEETATLEMWSVNVGKADAHILRTDDCTVLVDTGSKKSRERLLTALETLGITHLDAVFLTHDHKDHVGGVKALEKSGIEIGAWYTNGHTEKQGIVPETGDVLTFGDTRIAVFLPQGDYDNENNHSLILRVENGAGSILLTGDMKKAEERELLLSGFALDADVLKVPYHGDERCMTDDFLDLVSPRCAVIPTSTLERESTPDPEVLANLAGRGIATFVTQEADGGVYIALPETAQYFNLEEDLS